MMPSRSLFAAVALFCCSLVSAAGSSQDLGTVLAGNKNLTTYYALIQKYPDILLQLPSYSGVTVIAPSDDAFKNVPFTSLNGIWNPDDKDTTIPLLQYHILQGTVSIGALQTGPTYVKPSLLTNTKYTNVTGGQNVEINKQPGNTVVFTTSMGTRCTVVQSDIAFRGGLIQVVDNLLIPPAPLGNTTEAFQAPNFLGALYAGKIMPDVSYEENITVFAPVDAAFNRVGGSLNHLKTQDIARIMGYHIVPNQVLVSSSLTNGSRLQTLAKDASGKNAEAIVIRQSGNNKYINSAQIVQPDILIANGIMHLISDVLNPNASSVLPNPTQATQAPVFPVSSATNPFTSALPCTVSCPVTTSTAGGNGTSSSPTTTTTSSLFTSQSKGGAAGAMATAHVAGAALGLFGAGLVLL